MSRLGVSHAEFDDMTPLELDLALKDHSEYHFSYIKHFMQLIRLIGVVLRNKGLKKTAQIKDVKRFWRFPWEFVKNVKIPTKAEWKQLDKKYNRKKKIQ